MPPKPTSDLMSSAIRFALDDRQIAKLLAKRDEDRRLRLDSINAVCVDDPSHSRTQYQIKITFDYTPPQPGQEDFVVWVGFDRDGTFRIVDAKNQ